MQIPSLTVLIAVLCGGAVLGLIGALLAIPIAATIQAVVAELLDERAERINGPAPDSQMLGAPDTSAAPFRVAQPRMASR